MRPVQFILSAILFGLALLYVRQNRGRSLDRAAIFIFALVGVIMVFNPELTNTIANAVGVGRGADFLSYFGLMFLSFICILLYGRQRRLEARLTELARAIALDQAFDHPPADR